MISNFSVAVVQKLAYMPMRRLLILKLNVQ